MPSEVPPHVAQVIHTVASALAGTATHRSPVIFRRVGDHFVQEEQLTVAAFGGDPFQVIAQASAFGDSAAGLRYGMRRWCDLSAAFRRFVAVACSIRDDVPAPELAEALERELSPAGPGLAAADGGPWTTRSRVIAFASAGPGYDGAEILAQIEPLSVLASTEATDRRLPAHVRYLLAEYITCMEPVVRAPGWCGAMREAALRGDVRALGELWDTFDTAAIRIGVDRAAASAVADVAARLAETYCPEPRAPRRVLAFFLR